MTVEERLALLEQRLRRAEDELAIARLMASYGPLVGGSAHFLGPVRVDIDGDDAVAGAWQIVKRTTRALDGSAAARELLAAGALGRPV